MSNFIGYLLTLATRIRTDEHFTVPALPISCFIPLRPSHFSNRRFAPCRTQTINFIDTQRSTIKRQNHKTRVLYACAIKESSKLYFYSYSGLHSQRGLYEAA